MKLLIYSFYYSPDLCAGSFRIKALIEAFNRLSITGLELEVITTQPNRYDTYSVEVPAFEKVGNVTIHRIQLPNHKSGMFDQAKAFLFYYKNAVRISRDIDCDLIFATSSRLFTGFLAARMSVKKRKPLVLDIRDVFVDTLNSVLPSLLKLTVLPFIKRLERYTYNHAIHINLVSEGFYSYVKSKSSCASYSFITNGIDKEFLQVNGDPVSSYGKKIITYAGNIGEGQGLEKIIPDICQFLGESFYFRIIGAGGRLEQLKEELKKKRVKNFEIIPPISRNKLVKYYLDSDYLFLHLNNYEAFLKVLPSKLFEYGALNKKIIAGVSGYSASFIKENLPSALLFDPCSIKDFTNKWKSWDQSFIFNNMEFKNKFAREYLMNELATVIIHKAKEE